MTGATAETAPEPVPLPPGVIGYVVAVAAARSTHCDFMDRDVAESEAAQWRRAAIGTGRQYTVCEVREVAS